MVTINLIEELFHKKLARLEKNIVGQLQPSNSILITITEVLKCTNRNKDTPTSDRKNIY